MYRSPYNSYGRFGSLGEVEGVAACVVLALASACSAAVQPWSKAIDPIRKTVQAFCYKPVTTAMQSSCC